MFRMDDLVVFANILTPDGLRYPSGLFKVVKPSEQRKDVYELILCSPLDDDEQESQFYSAHLNEIRYADPDERNSKHRLPPLLITDTPVVFKSPYAEGDLKIFTFMQYISNSAVALKNENGEVFESNLSAIRKATSEEQSCGSVILI